jgi:hypothetical protein
MKCSKIKNLQVIDLAGFCWLKLIGLVYNVVGRAGFEPAKVSQRIYSPSSLAA